MEKEGTKTMARRDGDGNISFSPNSLVLVVAGAIGIGLSGANFFAPQLELEAVKTCFDNSKTAIENSRLALDVAGQHGQHAQEHVGFTQAITENRRLLLERTESRYTSADADKFRREQEQRDNAQDRRLTYIERLLDDQKNVNR